MDGGDGDQPPGCAACRFIPRSCPPDCPLAPHFNTADFSGLGSGLGGMTMIEFARSYLMPKTRRTFVELAAAGTSAGEEGRRLLVEAVLSEIEKELERPKPPSSSSSALHDATERFLIKLADMADDEKATVDALLEAIDEGMSILEVARYHDQDQDPDPDDQDSDHCGTEVSDFEGSDEEQDDGDDGVKNNDDVGDCEEEIELADLEQALKEFKINNNNGGVYQELGVNADGDSGALTTDDVPRHDDDDDRCW